MRVSDSAHIARAAEDVRLGGDAIACGETSDVCPGAHDGAGALVTHHEGKLRLEGLRARVPRVEVGVGATDRRGANLHQDLVDIDVGFGIVLDELDADGRFRFDDGAHTLAFPAVIAWSYEKGAA